MNGFTTMNGGQAGADKQGKKKTVAGQVGFVRSLHKSQRRFCPFQCMCPHMQAIPKP